MNGKTVKTLYLTDMDGTLLHSSGSLSETTRQGLKLLYENDIYVSVATSRSYSAAEILGDVKLRAPMILLGGARIFDPDKGQLLCEHTLPAEEAAFALKAVREANLSPLLYTQTAQDEQCIFYEETADPDLHAYVARMQKHYGDGRFRGVRKLEEAFSEKLFFVTARGDEEVLSGLLRRFDGHNVHAYLYSAAYRTIEITPVSKATGVRELRKITGAERIVAFGDNGNDQGLFEAADERIAVGNATQELKRLADRIIGSNDEDAVIREILLREKLS